MYVSHLRFCPVIKVSEKRQFGTISVGKRDDIGEVLVGV